MPQIQPNASVVASLSSHNANQDSLILADGDWGVFQVKSTPDCQIQVRGVNPVDVNGDVPTITYGTITVYGSNSPADQNREPTATGASWVQVKDTAGAGVAFSALGGSIIVDTYAIIAVRRVGGTGSVQVILRSNINK
jgi:hypothetical protein